MHHHWRPFLLFCFCTVSLVVAAQSPVLNYNISAELDDGEHTLKVDYALEYTHRSEQAIPKIIFHLWANALGDKTSAFTQQVNDAGDRDFYFAKENQLGGYRDLVFTSEGQTLEITPYQGMSDVVELQLPKVMEEGDVVQLSATYTLKIPEAFSRLGRGENAYQVSQWYPKPAVFDAEGWHPMPYLQWGEYYSEFATYDVKLTLPSDYLVAASGVLTTSAEKEKLKKYAAGGAFLSDAGSNKTLQFIGENIHDFAFFVDKTWKVELETFEVQGQPKEAWTFYRPENEAVWKGSAQKVRQAVEFMSEKVGLYPYKQASAVDAELKVGGGMEYPNVTVIGDVGGPQVLDQVLAHEVIHNWFYGMLANNERRYAWLDEGPTSYYEQRYMERYYGEKINSPVLPTDHSGWQQNHLAYIVDARRSMDMPSDSPSDAVDELGYGMAFYAKPQSAIKLLEAYYGADKVDLAFQDYYQKNKFTHVDAHKLKSSMNSAFQDDISWWFDQVIGSREVVDYCVQHARKSDKGWKVRVSNKGSVKSPLFLGNDLGEKQVFPGFTGQKTLEVPFSAETKNVIIDPDRVSMDLNQNNNVLRTEGLFRKLEPLKWRYLPGFPSRERTDIYAYPLVGWNQYDHWMAGFHINNIGLLPRKWSFHLSPLYSFAENELSGQGKLYLNQPLRKGKLRMLQMGLEAQRYNYRNVRGTDEAMAYHKVSPFLRLEWMLDLRQQKYQELEVRYDWIGEERPEYRDGAFASTSQDRWGRALVAYELGRKGALHPWHMRTSLEYSQYDIDPLDEQRSYLRYTLEGQIDLYYRPKNKVRLRGFVGAFLMNDARDSRSINSILARRSFGLAYQGHTDLFEETFLGRTASSGLLSRQVAWREGGFKTAFTLPFAGTIGNSNDWISSVNVLADFPSKSSLLRMVKVFLDVGYFSIPNGVGNEPDFSDQFVWSSGVSLHLANGAVQFHLPLLNSSNINDVLDMAGQDNVWKRISFTLAIKPDQLYSFLENTRLNF